VTKGTPGLQPKDGHPLTQIVTALVQRQAGVASPDAVDIPMVTITPPTVDRTPAAPVIRSGSGAVRLTFDDGPGAYTEQILDILDRYNVHATFYVIGRNVERYPSTMKRIAREGHAIGNHSYTHADLAKLSRDGVVRELSNTQDAVRNACGVTPTLFRPPYGSLNSTVRSVAASLGMSVNLWSVDPQDWAQPGSSVITRRVLSNDHPGSVVLLHILHQQTVTALPSIIEGIRQQGYTLQ
jgi:peptidoglycan/xylan/chitin deacetylase (PgdA/CDA1 family)